MITATTIVTAAEDYTLYAQWKGITYTIMYNGNGSTGGANPESQQKTYGTPLPLRTNSGQDGEGSLVRTNYSFAGWNPQADGSGTTYPAGGTLNDDLSTTAGATVWLYAQWDSGSGDLTLTGTKGTDWTYNSASRVYTIRNGAAVTVSGTTTRDSITVASGAQVKVTLNGVCIEWACPFNLESGANVTLCLSGTNKLQADYGAAGIHAPAGTTLTITGANGGELVATGGKDCAGIGGGDNEDGGTITISGGTVRATGGTYGAGIGGGSGGGGGTISVSGGSGYIAAGSDAPYAVGPGHKGSGGSFNGGAFPAANPYEW